jgi:hypothetical protein
MFSFHQLWIIIYPRNNKCGPRISSYVMTSACLDSIKYVVVSESCLCRVMPRVDVPCVSSHSILVQNLIHLNVPDQTDTGGKIDGETSVTDRQADKDKEGQSWILTHARHKLAWSLLSLNLLKHNSKHIYHLRIIKGTQQLPFTAHLCVRCGFQNKQLLFPHTALMDWSM